MYIFAYIVVCEYNIPIPSIYNMNILICIVYSLALVNPTLHCIMVDNELFKQIAVLKVLTCIYYCTMCGYILHNTNAHTTYHTIIYNARMCDGDGWDKNQKTSLASKQQQHIGKV